MVYKGSKEQMKGPIIVFFSLLLVAAILLIFAWHNWFAIFMGIIFLLPLPMIYSGMILSISMDEEKIVIVRPITKKVVRFKDIAFCAINALEDNKFLIYTFMKRRKSGKIFVKGVKDKLEYTEIVKKLSDTKNNHNLDINFNQAAKIPVSFVEDGDKLKDEIFKKINAEHVKILKS